MSPLFWLLQILIPAHLCIATQGAYVPQQALAQSICTNALAALPPSIQP